MTLKLCVYWVAFVLCLLSTSLHSQISVDFDADVKEGCSSVQANFLDLSTSTAGKITSWKWDLSGVNSDLASPGRIFATVGSYEICLTVKDEQNNEKTICKENFINVYDLPNADFEVDTDQGCAPLIVTYKDLSSSPNGSITKWSWGLNGSNSTVETSSINKLIFSEYANADSYTISLAITDEKGCSNSISKGNLINVLPKPTIEIGTFEPIGCSFPMSVDFRNFGEEENIEYEWDFGNGERFNGYDPGPVVYASEAAYDITVIATNQLSSCTDTLIFHDYINSGGTILFDFYPKTICISGSVQFEDLSPLEADDWEWDFGDGERSTERDPSHIYKNPGQYSVSLARKTADCEGLQVSIYKVTVNENPILEFEIDQINSCKLPAEVTFKETSGEQGLVRWYIGKPGPYLAALTESESTYAFEEYGSYEIRLLKQNSIGCGTIALIDTIDIEPLKIELTGKSEGCIPFTADLGFKSNSTSPIASVSWNITGAQEVTSVEDNISLEIAEVSNYSFVLAVENEIGCVDTLQGDDILQGGVKPTVDFGLSDDEVCPSEQISFENLSMGPADTWIWTFNDSTIVFDQNPILPFNSPGGYDVSLQVGHNGCYAKLIKDSLFTVNFPNVGFELKYNCDDPFLVKAINNSSEYDSLVWTYSSAEDTTELFSLDSVEIAFPNKEKYLVSLTAWNYENGCQNTYSDTVRISDLQAKFTVSETKGCAPLDLKFEDSSTDAISWKYFTETSRFSDDTIQDPTIRIYTAGEYENVGLIVKDQHGCLDTAFTPLIQVNAVDALFTAPDPLCIKDTLEIEHQSTSFFGDIIGVKWILGDNLDTSYAENAGFVIDEIGKHDIKLVAEDSWGCKDSITTGLAAYFRAPNFELAADSLSCTTHALTFRNILHANNYSYSWHFGDGDSSAIANPSHLYLEEGNYPVAVTIGDMEGCINEIELVQMVSIADPIASFGADSTFAACPPLITSFDNSSQNSLSYSWDFGDASGLSSEVQPSHLYIKAGIFDVSLIAVRTPFCKDTLNLSDLIQLDGPKGEFTFDVDSSCVPLKVSFEAELAEEYSLIWDFGDGNLEPVSEITNYSLVDYSYEKPGDFVPKIILEDSKNCKITREGETIQTHALTANFKTIDSVFCNNIPGTVLIEDDSYSTAPIVSYQWVIANEEYDVPAPTFTVGDTGRFDVLLVVGNSFCFDTLQMENYIKVGEAPTIISQNDTFNCIGTDIQLSAVTEDLRDMFLWKNELGEIISTDSELEVEGFNVGQYFIVEAQNEYECISIDTVNVALIDDRTDFAGPDKTICFGSSTLLDLNYGENVVWANVPDCTNCASVELAPDSLSSYHVEITNEYGCIVRDTLQVDVLYQDDIEAGDDQNVCISERPLLLAFVQGDIVWSPAEVLSDPFAQITAANIQESTLFFLESTKDECTLRDSVYITMIDKAQVEAEGDTVCYGDMAQIYATGDIDDVRWESEDASLSDHGIMNPTSNTRESAEFMVIGMLSGCAPDTAYASVMVYPEISGHLPEERNYFAGEDEVEVNLVMSSLGNYAYSWTPAEMISCTSCSTVMVQTADSSQMISVEILERDSGCSDTLSVMIRQYYGCESAKSGIGVPNIFTPNEDGVNDVLNIESPAFDDVNSIAIYDRWGERVFASSSIQDSWDGNHKGSPVVAGVYTYAISATCPDTGQEVYTSGDVTVIR